MRRQLSASTIGPMVTSFVSSLRIVGPASGSRRPTGRAPTSTAPLGRNRRVRFRGQPMPGRCCRAPPLSSQPVISTLGEETGKACIGRSAAVPRMSKWPCEPISSASTAGACTTSTRVPATLWVYFTAIRHGTPLCPKVHGGADRGGQTRDRSRYDQFRPVRSPTVNGPTPSTLAIHKPLFRRVAPGRGKICLSVKVTQGARQGRQGGWPVGYNANLA